MNNLENFPAGICLLKVNNRNTRTKCEICSKLTIKKPERRHVNFEHVIAGWVILLNWKAFWLGLKHCIKFYTCPWRCFQNKHVKLVAKKLTRSSILYNSLLSNLLRQSIWCFLIKWWSWIARLIEFAESINIYFIHSFGEKWTSWIHVNFSLIAGSCSSWSCSHNFTAPFVLNNCPKKVISRSEKEEKKTLLLLIWIWQLNHKNWDKIADATNVGMRIYFSRC